MHQEGVVTVAVKWKVHAYDSAGYAGSMPASRCTGLAVPYRCMITAPLFRRDSAECRWSPEVQRRVRWQENRSQCSDANCRICCMFRARHSPFFSWPLRSSSSTRSEDQCAYAVRREQTTNPERVRMSWKTHVASLDHARCKRRCRKDVMYVHRGTCRGRIFDGIGAWERKRY